MNRENLITKLRPWLEEPPDFYNVEQSFRLLGDLKSLIVKKKREIERIEDAIAVESDRPRSNEAKQKKLGSTVTHRDELADLESQLAIVEQTVKHLEYRKTMFNAASFALKTTMDL